MSHPVLTLIAAVDAALDEVAGVDPMYMSTQEKKAAMVGAARLRARAVALQLRMLAAADDVAVDSGARSTATWLADETRDSHGQVRSAARLADALDRRWRLVGEAHWAGRVNSAQAQVIAKALGDLPKDVDGDLLIKAEAHLVDRAAEFGPRELARLGARVLAAVAPEIAEEAEYRRLLSEERRARAATRLFFRPRGDGSTDVDARIPDHVANRLRAYLDGYTSPRNNRLGEVDELPLSRRRGEAFCAMLENLPTSGLPRQGGTATTVTVTIDLKALQADLGAAGVVVAHASQLPGRPGDHHAELVA